MQNIKIIYIPAILFVLSGVVSGMFLFNVHIFSLRFSLGVPPVYFPLAGVLFALAYVISLILYAGRTQVGSVLYLLLASTLGMYLASLSYFYYFFGASSHSAVPTLSSALGLGLSSAVGGAVTLAAGLPGVRRKVFYLSAGIALAFAIGVLNALIPTQGHPGSWSIKLGFDAVLLCTTWQVMMGMYMVLMGGGRGLVEQDPVVDPGVETNML